MSDTKHLFAQLIAGVFDSWIARIQEVVEAAQDSGEVGCDLPADALARQIVFAIEGGIMLSRLKKEEAPLKSCLDTLRGLLHLTQNRYPFAPTTGKASPKSRPMRKGRENRGKD